MDNTSENKNTSILLILMLFGSFCIGYNIAIAFHELGHAFAMMLDGGQIREFVLNPFSWSWNLGQDLNNPLFTAWGGVTFGLLFAILPPIILIWVKRYYFRIPILVMAGSAFLINGIYLIIGVFLNFGDGGELIQYGVSPVLIFVLGIFYFLISIILWAIIQLLLGINSNVSFSKRLVVLCSGITPYLLMIFLYNLLFNNKQLLIWSSFAFVGIVTCFIFSIAGHFWSKLYFRYYESDYYNKGYRPVAIVNIIGIFIIIGELIIFGIRENPF